MSHATQSDRYEKRSTRRTATGSIISNAKDLDTHNAQDIDEDECRSVHTELDYKRKDASRHIVQGKSNPVSLRQRLLRNLEGVRKNKPILKSEVGSVHSMRSRMSTISTRQQNQLAKIDEADRENCEICSNEIAEEEDAMLNEEINRSLIEEENVKTAYNEFRKKRGLAAIDFTVV